MIRLFGQTDTSFNSNGDIVLAPLKAKVTKRDNDEYYLSLETDLSYIDHFLEGNIVVANTPTGDQAFRIGNVTKTKNKLSAKCYHVFYDSERYLIADSYVVDKTCNDALSHLNGATEPVSEFSTISDVLTVNSYRCVRKSLYEAVKDVIERWGGHLIRDNFTIAIRDSIGQDNGIIVQYRKNLKDITCEENWDSVVTKLLPVGKDGILLNAVNPSASIYVESQTQYAIPYVKAVSFNQDINQDDYLTEDAYKQALVNDLLSQATAYVETNCVPQISYTLKANLEKVTDIGDTIQVIDERLGVNILTHVVGFTYDCIAEQYSEVEFGNFQQSLSGFANTMTVTAETVAKEQAQQVGDEILGIMKYSYVIYDGTKLMVVDQLPKEDAENVIIVDNTGIGFSQSGISGQQTSKWFINGALYVQDLVVDADTVTDVVKAHGTTNGWSWKKYSSGTVEAWKKVTLSPTWSALGSFYKGASDVTYPFNIADAVITANVETCPDTGWVANANAVDNTKANVTVVRSGNSGDVTVSIMVKGNLP